MIRSAQGGCWASGWVGEKQREAWRRRVEEVRDLCPSEDDRF